MDAAKAARPNHRDSGAVPLWALIDDRPLTRISFERLLKAAGRDFAVIGVGAPRDLLDPMGQPRPGLQIAIYRVTTPSVADDRTVAEICYLSHHLPSVLVVLLCERDDPEEVSFALARGVRGYLTTSLDPGLVVEALRLVRAGGIFVPSQALDRGLLVSPTVAPTSDRDGGPGIADGNGNGHRAPDGLTGREAAVLQELARGSTNKGIARTLGIQESTVKVHVRQLMKKLKASNRTQLALQAQQLPGFLPVSR